MANTVLTASIIAEAAVKILDNELVMADKVYRDYESEFNKTVNGYKPGATVTIRRPTDFTVRSGAVASAQDVVEGSTSITIDTQEGVDFSFTSADLTLKIEDLSERVIQPAMLQIANRVDATLHGLYKYIPNWVGTPGQVVNSFSDFALAPQRLTELGTPYAGRTSVLSPADNWGMVGSQTALYMQNPAQGAYREGMLGKIAGIETYESQNVRTHTVGTATGTPLVNGASQNTTWALTKDTNTQSLITDGWTNSVTGILKQGDVFTIAGVYAVNPVTKDTQSFLRQFVVMADANSGASTGPATLTISPPIITSGAFQTCSAAPADNAAITVLGTGGTGYRQNMVFHKNAFALATVPMIRPPGAVDVGRKSYKGLSVRVIPVYDGTNDISMWRLDMLYGVKCIDPRLAVRLSGT
jgi:P22 coat protein - gene protein 5